MAHVRQHMMYLLKYKSQINMFTVVNRLNWLMDIRWKFSMMD